MAQPYFDRLSQIVADLDLEPTGGATLETRHFFNGAALYANGKICATLGPAGFALKLPRESKERLIEDGKGAEFRFFPKGPVKREYVALSESVMQDEQALQTLMEDCISYVIAVAK